jgi:hypothetical protein
MQAAPQMRNPHQPLRGMRLVVTAYNLEQKEHRGIAVYTKALIRSLRQAGASVWLLTEIEEPLLAPRIGWLPGRTRRLVEVAQLLEALSGESDTSPATTRQSRKKRWLKNLPLVGFWISLQEKDIFGRLFPRFHYPRKHLRFLRIRDIYDNPYLRMERLGYLRDVEGLICAGGIFGNSMRNASRRKPRTVTVDLRPFSALITCCPLNIAPSSGQVFIQTVHDLIPLEYSRTHDVPTVFVRRLEACRLAMKGLCLAGDGGQVHQLRGTLSPRPRGACRGSATLPLL